MELVRAVINNDLVLVKRLLDGGADINVENGDALFNACHLGHVELVNLLLDRGADVHVDDDVALWIASSKGRSEIVNLLLDRGANMYALHNIVFDSASYEGHLEVVILLLKRGSSPVVFRKPKTTEIGDLIKNYSTYKKYWIGWRRFMVSRWARRLLWVWFRPDMPGGLEAKKQLLTL